MLFSTEVEDSSIKVSWSDKVKMEILEPIYKQNSDLWDIDIILDGLEGGYMNIFPEMLTILPESKTMQVNLRI